MEVDLDLAAFIASVVLLGLVSGTHTALEVLSYSRAEKSNGQNGSTMHFFDRLLGNPVSTYLSLGIGRILSLALVLMYSVRVGSDFFQESFFGLFSLVVAALATPLFAGKLVALRNAEAFLRVARFLVYPIIYALWPIALLLIGLFRRASPRALESLSYQMLPLRKRVELFGYKNGGMEATEERELMSSVFDFGDTKVREVMVPRIDMVAVNLNADTTDALDQIVEAGLSRFPVYDESIDKIVGMVYTKDLLKKTVSGEPFTLGQITRDVFFVPESKRINELLSEFKRRKKHIAIVVDEYGGTAGLITLEDVLEELVGDIQDEFDSEEELIKRLNGDSALCHAKVRLDELEETLGLDVPEEEAETLGGFLYEIIGRVPREGEQVRRDGVEYRIHSVVRHRINKVLIKGLSSIRKKRGDDIV